MKFILAILLLLSSSCVLGPMRTWDKDTLKYCIVDDSLDKEMITKALNEWTEKTGVKFVESKYSESDFIFSFGTPLGCADGQVAKCYHVDRLFILYNKKTDWSDKEWNYKLTIHEIGHILGVRHSDDEKSIMYPILPRDKASNMNITDEDIKKVKSYFGL